jgi:hypothetical protein
VPDISAIEPIRLSIFQVQMGWTSWNEHRSVVISRETDASALHVALTYGTMLSIK